MPRKYRGSRLAMLTLLWFAGAASAYLFGELLLRTLGADAWPLVLASSALVGVFPVPWCAWAPRNHLAGC